ncbi:hypothetical protein D3C72_1952250 [compost metagenome]
MQTQQAALPIRYAVIALDQARARMRLIGGIRHAQSQFGGQLHHQGFIQGRCPHAIHAADIRLEDVPRRRRALRHRG